ncbi:PadR family transcriptional regulator [Nocardia salmonicida]|uniref:PadR family transcriptional regulator n=1 Tax=Nocardia salmonicida TaxID=53431 RepID=UPI00367E1818
MQNQEHREFGHFRRGRGPAPREFGPDRQQFRHGGRHGHGPEFGPGFGPGFGRGRGRGGRGRRGDVRAAVLLLLVERPMHGYELIQQIRDRSDDVWRPSPGSIYPALAQLEDEGLVLIEKVAGRKTAQLTDEGKAYVETHREDLGDPWAEVRQDVGAQALDLRGLVGQVMGAVGQVAQVGTAQQAAKAAEVLAETRRSLYRILAEDDVISEGDATPEK